MAAAAVATRQAPFPPFTATLPYPGRAVDEALANRDQPMGEVLAALSTGPGTATPAAGAIASADRSPSSLAARARIAAAAAPASFATRGPSASPGPSAAPATAARSVPDRKPRPTPEPAPNPASRPATKPWSHAATAASLAVGRLEGPVRAVPGMPAPELGQASTYGPAYPGLIAVPRRGSWLVEIIWHGRYVIRRTNDYGPDQRLFPTRVIDLDVATFEALSGQSWTRGVLWSVKVVYLRYLGA